MAPTLTLEEDDLQEEFHARGWTDGLPVVPPTPERVAAMLEAGGAEPDDVLGAVAERGVTATAEHAAINAVMAGCPPACFPLVLAAVRAFLDPAFNPHAAVTSTGGAAVLLVVSGPLAAEVGMDARHNALAGGRANATIGRAVRLLARNVLGARTGGLDGSSLGHPGKLTFCLAEDPPPAPWEPLRVELGWGLEDTTVTALPSEGPRQVANHLEGSGEGILRTLAAAIASPAQFSVGKGTQGVVVLGPEHAGALLADGWTRRAVREHLAAATRVTPQQLHDAGVPLAEGMEPGPDGRLPTLADPDDLLLVTAGGAGAGWSAWIPMWAPKLHARAVTRRVAPPGEALPDCGPDGCALPWAGEG
jgi:hypothetical protein